MSDHLSTLARRALQAPRIHPRAPSRFEGESAAVTFSETAADVPSAPVDTPPPRSVPPLRPDASVPLRPETEPVLDMETPPPGEPREGRNPLPPAPPQWPIGTVSARVEAAPPLTQPVSASSEPVLPGVVVAPRLEPLAREQVEHRVHERLDVHHERIEHRDTVEHTLEQRVERLTLVEPQGYPQVAPSAAPPRSEHAAVTAPQLGAHRVEINIGRIEVLPAEPAAVPRHDNAPRQPVVQSLEAYLQERNNAGRGRGGRE